MKKEDLIKLLENEDGEKDIDEIIKNNFSFKDKDKKEEPPIKSDSQITMTAAEFLQFVNTMKKEDKQDDNKKGDENDEQIYF